MSGQSILSAMPARWPVERLGNTVWVRARLGWKGLTADEYVDDGVPMLATPNIKRHDIDFASANRITTSRYEESPEIKLTVGDVLLTKDGSTIGIANMVRTLPEPTTVNGSIAVLTPAARVESRFLLWLLQSSEYQSLMRSWQDGMGVPHLFQSDIKRIPLPVPAISEQRAIADFLDRETAQIDAFIAKNEELIALLTERRAAVINEPFAAHGANSRLAQACEAIVDCPHTTPEVDVDGPYEAVRTASVRAGRFVAGQGLSVNEATWRARNGLSGPRAGDVLFTREAPAGEACMVPSAEVCLGQRMVLLRVSATETDGEFLMWQLYSREVQRYFELSANGSTVTNIRLPLLRATPIWLPSLRQQQEVRADLIEKLGSIEDAIDAAGRAIDLVRERRGALISAAVTGKIDVGVD